MQTNYLEAISTVLNLMKQPDSVCKNISMHRTCYTTLFKYLIDNGISFSMDAALEWLEIVRDFFGDKNIQMFRLPISIACHVGAGVKAIAVIEEIK